MTERQRGNQQPPVEQAAKTFQVTAEPYIPDDVLRAVSDDLSMYATNTYFVLSFLQAEYPIEFRTPEPLQPLKTKCIAQMLVAHSDMDRFMDVLVRGFRGYLVTQGRDPREFGILPEEPES